MDTFSVLHTVSGRALPRTTLILGASRNAPVDWQRDLAALGALLDRLAARSPNAKWPEANDCEIMTLDTATSVHVDATQNGRVIASGDGRYLTIHQAGAGVAIDVRSEVPLSVEPGARRP